jgi:hypothetical protein
VIQVQDAGLHVHINHAMKPSPNAPERSPSTSVAGNCGLIAGTLGKGAMNSVGNNNFIKLQLYKANSI